VAFGIRRRRGAGVRPANKSRLTQLDRQAYASQQDRPRRYSSRTVLVCSWSPWLPNDRHATNVRFARSGRSKLCAIITPSQGKSLPVLVATRAIYSGLISPPTASVKAELYIAYGTHPRQTIDIHATSGSKRKTVLLYVPGGGFTAGDKRIDDVFYANLANWFASEGLVAVNMYYRLAPDHVWPAGPEDVTSVLGWIAANIEGYGGDPDNIVVFGQSAGATHVATSLCHPELNRIPAGVRGVVLASGMYRIGPLIVTL
jgi:acetyl esterase/lipase